MSSVSSASDSQQQQQQQAGVGGRRVFIITGSNTGVGLATARLLAQGESGSAEARNEHRHLILACRTESKARAAIEQIQSSMSPEAKQRTVVEFMPLDLVDLRSIDSFVSSFRSRSLPLHVLLCNAGVNKAPTIAQPLRLEGQWVANYLGHFYLTQQLLPLLESSAPSRVINVTSYMHRIGSTDFERIARAPSGHRSYSTSKLAQIVQAYALQRQYGPRGVSFFLVHPGACFSDIWNTLEPAWLRRANPLLRALFLTTEQGAAPSVHAATVPLTPASREPDGCLHFGPYATPLPGWELLTDAWQPGRFSKVTQSKTSGVTYDQQTGDKLMALSEKMVDEWKAAAREQEGQ